jgi:transcriptional regulator with PAS, ATPase and Fis domain
VEDIQGKIETLSLELARKTSVLQEQQKKIDILTNNTRSFFVEIRSKAFGNVIDLAQRIAPYDSSVLITGETGVGKEVLGRYIHSLSTRAKNRFFAINCGALPETLLESELFGHKAGSFTGAVHDRAGLLEEAQGGTVFLDEIGDISPALQLKLLRVLQEREITRVGENKPRSIDVRIISATNRNLNDSMQKGLFRDDLFYRLSIVEIDIPPLRKRKEDILPLVRFFITRFSQKLRLPGLKIDASCFNYLQSYGWPGNVRELENAIERSALLCKDKTILPYDLPPRIVNAQSGIALFGAETDLSIEQIEHRHILAVLKSVDGNQTRAAKILGISQATLWRKLKKYGT